MKKVLCTIIAMVMIVSMFGGVLLAEVRTDHTTLSRGGSSVVFPAARKDGASGSSWCSNLRFVHAFGGGTAAGLIASNRFVSRMRTNETQAHASNTITHSSANYSHLEGADNRVWQSYFSSHGGQYEYYRMAVSMSISSGHPSASVTYRWNP